jgi:hypothetical protein
VPLPNGPHDRAVAFETADANPEGDSEWLVFWQNAKAERVAVFRFIVENGQPDRACREAMLAGLRLQSADEWRDWAAFDFALGSPPSFRLDRAVLAAGVCYLRFRHGRDFIGLRRLSAADAVLGAARKPPDAERKADPALGDLETWCRLVYAAEFHDMQYQVDPAADHLGRPMLRLSGKRRLLAPIELKWLIPEHRRLPTRIDVLLDPDANKVYCVEVRNPKGGLEPVIDEFERSLSMTVEGIIRPAEPPGGPSDWSGLPENRRNRLRSLLARVRRSPSITFQQDEQGRTVITYPYARPRGLRLLRLLGGLPAGEQTTEKRLELDLIGSFVWQRCDGNLRVCDLVEAVRERFRISYREAELSVAHFVRDLGNRGILALEMPKEGH